jgi:GABA permease
MRLLQGRVPPVRACPFPLGVSRFDNSASTFSRRRRTSESSSVTAAPAIVPSATQPVFMSAPSPSPRKPPPSGDAGVSVDQHRNRHRRLAAIPAPRPNRRLHRRGGNTMESTPVLRKALNQRQLRMITIGGVIGAGLFVGSGVVIAHTGPAAFIAYAISGLLIVLVMRMLAEMAVANPSTGSFADYARDALGGWAGFSVGWLYWYFWVIVVGFEAIAGAKIIQYWIPGVPLWLWALILMTLMTGTNLFSVSSFGEFEFWFAGVKVAAICLFIGAGSLYVLGLWPHKSVDFSNLWTHGGFLPLGFGAITVGIVTVIFSMVGPEIATIAAAESQDPERAVAKAANSVILRIALFFVTSVFLLATILPWNDKHVSASPFVAAFDRMGVPYASHLMNAVVLTAVLSCLNSGMYTASRMLFVLAARQEAPARLIRLSSRGVPATAILASSIVGFLCVIAAAVSPNTVFAFLLNSSGALILFIYLLIALSQIVLRYRTEASRLRVKMWLFPVLSILTAAAIVLILAQMYVQKDVRSQLLLSLLSWAVVIAVYFASRWLSGQRRFGKRLGIAAAAEARAERDSAEDSPVGE